MIGLSNSITVSVGIVSELKNSYTIEEVIEIAKKHNAKQEWIDDFIKVYDRLLLACEELQEESKDDPLLRWEFNITRRGSV